VHKDPPYIRPHNYSTFKVNGEIEVLQGSFTSRSFKPHFHDTYALILVESGIADYSYKKNEYVVNPNRLLVLNPYEVHTGKSLGEGIWNFRSMYIPQDIVTSNYNSDQSKSPQFINRIVDDANFLRRYQILHEKLLTAEITIDEQSELTLLLNDLSQLAGLDVKYQKQDKYSAVAHKMRDYIHEYYMDNIQLDDLMTISGLSRFHLIKVYREKYGLPPHQYLNILRIEKAKQLLIKGMASTEVAYSVGYFDQSHFIKHFKKIVGVTPKAYMIK
jgi:AraC-like DNA-binding protein